MSITPFVRDRFTWLAYFSLAFFSYIQAALGPLMPFLRDELDLSYTISGLHFSAFALGMITAGLSADLIARRVGRAATYWWGGIGMAATALIFTIGRPVALTIGSAYAMGSLGGMLLVMIQATLSDHHGNRRAIPLTESNIAASISASFAPLLVGLLERIGVGWRGALWAGCLYWIFLLVAFRNSTVPAGEHVRSTQRVPVGRLPIIFWTYWLVLFLSVSVEWSVVFWGADFLIENINLSKADAASVMTVYFVAVVLGRVAGSRAAARFPIQDLMLGASTLTLIGFLMFWGSALSAVSISGLFLVGLGVANLFPLMLSIGSSVVPSHQIDRASGRISLGAGSAILIAPQILGSFADATDISTAYGVVFGLLIAVIAVVAITRSRST